MFSIMNDPKPKRGEVWTVDFDPTKGAEIQQQRPAVVISSDSIGKLPLKLVVPVTGWKPAFESNLWHVRLNPTPQNGLTKPSAADALQVRSVSIDRCYELLWQDHPARDRRNHPSARRGGRADLTLSRFEELIREIRRLEHGETLSISLPEDEAGFQRHGQGEWGELGAHDRAENERALKVGGRLFSVYTAGNGTRFHIIIYLI
jgi:mRNA interferase MazF